jgi:GT2 family glycosyltransferase
MIRADARLRVILVNYNGGELLERSVRSVLNSQWPGEIDVVIVDNASTDESLAAVEMLEGVVIIRRDTNEGFGANNHGFADLVGDELEVDLPEPGVVALLNPDAAVGQDAFRLLAAALDEDERIGAASPLIVFDRPFAELTIEGGEIVIDSIRSGQEELGAQCHGIDGAERLPGETAPVWICPARSTLRVPVVHLGAPIVVSVRAGSGSIDGMIIDAPEEISLDLASRQTYRVVQNAGVRIGDRGTGINRGFSKRVDENLGPDAPLWCGAAVVFHPEYLRSIGGFDPEYFLYYEDVDLGLRGLVGHWKTVHVPAALVEHRHSDRSVQGTKLVEVLQHRNRLLTLVRHGSIGEAASGFARAALTPVSLTVSALRRPHERRERLRLAAWRAAALKQAVGGLPHARRARNEITQNRNK